MRLEPAVPEKVLAAIRAPFLEAGATRLDAPVLQPLGLLLDLAGEALRERLLVVQGDGGEELALRPDFTIPAAWMVDEMESRITCNIERKSASAKPVSGTHA